eukprot:m.239728 g.239728  ORF g.239728 m.239728 type:complete len:857 (-) comp33750_c0_seq3:147-2717(-)
MARCLLTFLPFLVYIVFLLANNAKANEREQSGFVNAGSPGGVTLESDCSIRQQVWQFGKAIAPNQGNFDDLHDAMQLQNGCNISSTQDRRAADISRMSTAKWLPPSFAIPQQHVVYADPTDKGNDSNDGSEGSPFHTILRALTATRALPTQLTKTIILRAGVFFVQKTIILGLHDSNLVIQNFAGEMVSVSGGIELTPSWQKHPSPRSSSTFVTPLPSNVEDVLGLRVNGFRAIRARFPNIANAETHSSIIPLDGWIRDKTKWLPPIVPPTPAIEVNSSASDWPSVTWPMNESGGVPPMETGAGDQGLYTMGIGGPCEEMSPSYGYSCSPGGGPRNAGQHMHPSGLTYTQALLPHTPYANATSAVVHAWRPAHWFTVQFEVGKDTNSTFDFSRGGFQGAEGYPEGAEWFIENVEEELDSAMEYWFDRENHLLYYIPNASNPSTAIGNATFVATNLKTIFSLEGSSPAAPVSNVTIRGLCIRDTALTFLDVHGLPSGGDWALPYVGAVTLNNTAQVELSDNVFTRLDGLGIILLGYNNNTHITSSEFEYLGGSAIVLWGRTSSALDEKATRHLPWSDHPNGPDGRELDCPRHTNISHNVAHHLGIWQKQSSFVFQAVSAWSNIVENVVYNLPRAAINLNDGFCGGDIIERNLLANTCRESGDHGPINSWDRIPYITPCATGAASIIPATRHIRGNFILGTYSSQECIDNDDGSAHYLTTGNVLAYGDYGMKSDFGGWQNHHIGNIYPWVCSCYGEGANDTYANNTCVVRDGYGCGYWPKYASDCMSRAGPVPIGFTTHDNGVYTREGNVSVCETKGKPGGIYNLTTWVAMGHDRGSFETTLPSDDELAKWVHKMLDF